MDSPRAAAQTARALDPPLIICTSSLELFSLTERRLSLSRIRSQRRVETREAKIGSTQAESTPQVVKAKYKRQQIPQLVGGSTSDPDKTRDLNFTCQWAGGIYRIDFQDLHSDIHFLPTRKRK